ncbi:hypothetical protein VZT92_018531 [Zoarces viviparus]|uniref:Uncharacterized protein n=1 Tax=Zoarces viviparus TaxID=48416 RepID=A0AAW1EIG7_ZOAVI
MPSPSDDAFTVRRCLHCQTMPSLADEMPSPADDAFTVRRCLHRQTMPSLSDDAFTGRRDAFTGRRSFYSFLMNHTLLQQKLKESLSTISRPAMTLG